MNFTKVKLLICLCLLVVNVIFFALCVRLVSEKNYLSEEEAELAEKNLAENGVNVNIGKEERRLYDLPIYYADTVSEEKNISEAYMNVTESFFDVKVDESAFVKTPDGYSVSVKGADGEVLGSSLVTDDMYFECLYGDSESEKEYVGISDMPRKDELDTAKGDEYETARKFVDSAIKNSGMKFIYSGTMDNGDGKTVCFSQELSDITVTDIYINVFVKNGEILYCGGRITDKAPQKAYSTDITDSIDALYILYDYLREDTDKNLAREISVENITMTYRSFRYDYGKYYIIPTWEIDYTDIDGVSCCVRIDAVTGENITVIQKD